MHKNQKTKAKSRNRSLQNYALKIFIGSLVSIGVFFVFALAASFILWKKDADTSVFKYVIFALAVISGFIGGFAAVRPVREKGFIFGALSSILPCAAVAVTSVLISKNGLAANGWIFIALNFIFSAVGGIVAVNKRK